MTRSSQTFDATLADGGVVAVLQARMSSTRLPGKVLLLTCGKTLLQHQIERILRSRRIDRLVIATSTHASDDPIERLCRELSTPVYRGSMDDVLDRMVGAARPYRPQWLVRLTGDCPLACPEVIDHVIGHVLLDDADYGSNTLKPSYPDGLDVECVRFKVLEEAWREAAKPSEREHVTPFIYKHPQRYRLCSVNNDLDLSNLRWTVDEAADFVFVSQIYELLYHRNPAFAMSDILTQLKNEPMLGSINAGFVRNEGYMRSLAKEAPGAAAI